MSTVTAVDPARKDQAIDEAAGRNVAIVLSLRDGDLWSVYKSRFLGTLASQRLLFVEYPPGAVNTAPPKIHKGEIVGVAFRRGHKKCVFTSTVLDRGEYTLNKDTCVEALTLSWPDTVEEVQRRAYYRVSVPRHKNVAIELWQGGPEQRKKAGTAIWPSYTGRVIDLSAGGLRLTLPPNQNPRLDIGEAIGIEFQPEPTGPAFLLSGVVRYVGPTPDGSVTMGVQFAGLEATVEGRRILQQLLRVVNQYQRFELRRARLLGRNDD